MIQKKCVKCGKKFEGHTDKQVDYQIAVHDLSKHKKTVVAQTTVEK